MCVSRNISQSSLNKSNTHRRLRHGRHGPRDASHVIPDLIRDLTLQFTLSLPKGHSGLSRINISPPEEVLFRGFIFKQLQTYYSLITVYIVDSLLFATIHIPILLFISHYSGNSLLIALYITFASSLVFCWLYTYSKNLWVAIIAHFIMDFLLLIY